MSRDYRDPKLDPLSEPSGFSVRETTVFGDPFDEQIGDLNDETGKSIGGRAGFANGGEDEEIPGYERVGPGFGRLSPESFQGIDWSARESKFPKAPPPLRETAGKTGRATPIANAIGDISDSTARTRAGLPLRSPMGSVADVEDFLGSYPENLFASAENTGRHFGQAIDEGDITQGLGAAGRAALTLGMLTPWGQRAMVASPGYTIAGAGLTGGLSDAALGENPDLPKIPSFTTRDLQDLISRAGFTSPAGATEAQAQTLGRDRKNTPAAAPPRPPEPEDTNDGLDGTDRAMRKRLNAMVRRGAELTDAQQSQLSDLNKAVREHKAREQQRALGQQDREADTTRGNVQRTLDDARTAREKVMTDRYLPFNEVLGGVPAHVVPWLPYILGGTTAGVAGTMRVRAENRRLGEWQNTLSRVRDQRLAAGRARSARGQNTANALGDEGTEAAAMISQSWPTQHWYDKLLKVPGMAVAGAAEGAPWPLITQGYNAITQPQENPRAAAYREFLRVAGAGGLPDDHPEVSRHRQQLGEPSIIPPVNPAYREAAEFFTPGGTWPNRMSAAAAEGAAGTILPSLLSQYMRPFEVSLPRAETKVALDAMNARRAAEAARRTSGGSGRTGGSPSPPPGGSGAPSPAPTQTAAPTGQASPQQPLTARMDESRRTAGAPLDQSADDIPKPKKKKGKTSKLQGPSARGQMDGGEVETLNATPSRERHPAGHTVFRNPSDGQYITPPTPLSRGGSAKNTSSPPRAGLFRGALDLARRYASGGRVVVGAVDGTTPGRADELPVDVPSGSFVIPADIVAYLGEGNSRAGHVKLDQAFGSSKARASGGPAVPILISDGEYVVDPETVVRLGQGNADQGHAILEKLVLKLRKDHVLHLQRLPSPARD